MLSAFIVSYQHIIESNTISMFSVNLISIIRLEEAINFFFKISLIIHATIRILIYTLRRNCITYSYRSTVKLYIIIIGVFEIFFSSFMRQIF